MDPTTTPATPTGNTTGTVPAPPHTTQVGPVPEVPKFWADPVRIVRDMLDLWEKDPEAANALHEFARYKLAQMRK